MNFTDFLNFDHYLQDALGHFDFLPDDQNNTVDLDSDAMAGFPQGHVPRVDHQPAPPLPVTPPPVIHEIKPPIQTKTPAYVPKSE